jgi:uncharacterized protein (DUF1684 family)
MIGCILLCVVALFLQNHAIDDESHSVSKETKWRKILLEERQKKDHEFKTSPTSPMAGVKRFTLKPGQKMFILKNNGNIALSDKKETGVRFSVMGREDQWYWEPYTSGITCTTGSKTLRPGSPLPGITTFKVDRFTMAAYSSKNALTLLVFDPMRPQIKKFSHLLYYPPAPEYAVPASIEKFQTFERRRMLTNRSQEKIFYKYARIRFRLSGKPLQLTAFKFSLDKDDPDSSILFIPFSDTTNGKETYGTGRFLEVHEPEGKTFIFDFNRCYNPLCNYAPVYNCPLPPLENNLEVPIKAGEKTYPH